jgi:hypothetical protein
MHRRGGKMCIRTEDIELKKVHTGIRKIHRTDRGRTLIIRGASFEQQRKVVEAYIWILQNFMPEFGEIKSGEGQAR